MERIILSLLAAGIFILLFSVTSCGVIPLHPADTAIVSFSCDFETGAVEDYPWTAFSLAREESLTLVTNPVRQGIYAARFEIAYGDKPTTGTRAELGLSDLYPHGSEAWYSWSVYIDPASVESGKWQVMGQWHDAPDPYQDEAWSGYVAVPPPVGLDYEDQEFKLVLRSRDLWGAGEVIGTYAVTKGEWIDMLFHIKWSEGNDGFIRWWVNGNPITGSAANEYKVTGRNCRNRAGNFFRIGIYRDSSVTTPFVAFYDDIKIGKTLEEVTQ